jgi:hypothetical protein
MVRAGTDLSTDEYAFAEAVFFHEEGGNEGVGVVGDVVAFGVTEESVSTVVHFEYAVEGAFDDGQGGGAESGFSRWSRATIATETLSRAVWGTTAELIGAAAITTAAIATGTAIEASEFASAWSIEAGRSLIAAVFEPCVGIALRAVEGRPVQRRTIERRAVVEAVAGHAVTAKAIATTTSSTASSSAAAVAVELIAVVAVVAVGALGGIVVSSTVLGTVVRAVGTEELVAPVGEVVATAGVFAGGGGFCGCFGLVVGIGFVAATAVAAIGTRRTAVGIALRVTVAVAVAVTRSRFVVTEIEVIGAEVTHPGFGFDVREFSFEAIGESVAGVVGAGGFDRGCVCG